MRSADSMAKNSPALPSGDRPATPSPMSQSICGLIAAMRRSPARSNGVTEEATIPFGIGLSFGIWFSLLLAVQRCCASTTNQSIPIQIELIDKGEGAVVCCALIAGSRRDRAPAIVASGEEGHDEARSRTAPSRSVSDGDDPVDGLRDRKRRATGEADHPLRHGGHRRRSARRDDVHLQGMGRPLGAGRVRLPDPSHRNAGASGHGDRGAAAQLRRDDHPELVGRRRPHSRVRGVHRGLPVQGLEPRQGGDGWRYRPRVQGAHRARPQGPDPRLLLCRRADRESARGAQRPRRPTISRASSCACRARPPSC